MKNPVFIAAIVGMVMGVSEIEGTCPEATVLDGIAVRGYDVSGSQSDIEKWIDGLSWVSKNFERIEMY